MGQGDIPITPRSPLRRRREKRQLEKLAQESGHEANPTAARAHIRVLGDTDVAHRAAKAEEPQARRAATSQ